MSSSKASTGSSSGVIRREIPSMSRFRDRAFGTHARSHRSDLAGRDEQAGDEPAQLGQPRQHGHDVQSVREIAAEVARAIGRPADAATARTATAQTSTARAQQAGPRGSESVIGTGGAGKASDTGPSALGKPEQETQREPAAAGMSPGVSLPRGPSEHEIRERAYQIYLERGGAPGDPVADWLRAEGEMHEAYGLPGGR